METYNAYNCRWGYRGARRGFEYQGDLTLGAFGLLTFGARNETESSRTMQDPVPPTTFTPIDAAQTTHSGFANVCRCSCGSRISTTRAMRRSTITERRDAPPMAA